MELEKINEFAVNSDFEKFFYKINKEAYLLAFRKIFGKQIKLIAKKTENKIAIYLDKRNYTKNNEVIEITLSSLLTSNLNTIVKLRKNLFSYLLLDKTYQTIEKDMINLVAYKYIFERFVNKTTDNSTVVNTLKKIISPHKFFMEDEKYSNILKRYGFLFNCGTKQKKVEEYFHKSQELFLHLNPNSVIELGFTVSEEEDYLIALVFNLKQNRNLY